MARGLRLRKLPLSGRENLYRFKKVLQNLGYKLYESVGALGFGSDSGATSITKESRFPHENE